jgi:hypothetical protein
VARFSSAIAQAALNTARAPLTQETYINIYNTTVVLFRMVDALDPTKAQQVMALDGLAARWVVRVTLIFVNERCSHRIGVFVVLRVGRVD